MKQLCVILLFSVWLYSVEFDVTEYSSLAAPTNTSKNVFDGCIKLVYNSGVSSMENFELLFVLANVVKVLPSVDKNYKKHNYILMI